MVGNNSTVLFLSAFMLYSKLESQRIMIKGEK